MTHLIFAIAKIVILGYMGINIVMLVSIILKKDSNIRALAESAVNEAIGKSKSHYFSRENLEAMMSKYGFFELVHDYNAQASTFLMLKFGLSGLFAIAFAIIMPGVALKIAGFAAGAFVGFFSIDWMLQISNKSDNKRMQDDIITIYNIIKTHSKSGVFITDSLVECQRSVCEPRLKKALLELNNTIFSGRMTMADAVDLFNARFDNEQIDNLSVIIKQTLRTGRSDEILSDVTKQIEDANKIKLQNVEDQQKRKNAFIQVAFFMAISGIALYMVAVQMMASIWKI